MTRSYMIIGFSREKPIIVNNFFSGSSSKFRQTLENPPRIRRMGWDLITLDHAKVVEGKYYTVKNGDRKTIRLYSDLSLVAKVSLGRDFLGWGQDEEAFNEKPKINTTALVEFIYNFVSTSKSLAIDGEYEEEENVIFKLSLNNLVTNLQKKFLLSPYPSVHNEYLFNTDVKSAPYDNKEFDAISVEVSQLVQHPEMVAYNILCSIYQWFGFEDEQVPYTNEGAIDKNQIKKIYT